MDWIEIFRDGVLPCLYSFIGCIGYSIIYNIHGKRLIPVGLGGVLSWGVYLLCGAFLPGPASYFLAAVALSLYSEIMARVVKAPVTVFLLIALFPLVPGGGIYYTMEYGLLGETQQFLKSLLSTLGTAGALAVGILLVSSAMRLGVRLRELWRVKTL